MDKKFPKNNFPNRRFAVIEVALVFGKIKNSKVIIKHRDFLNIFLSKINIFNSCDFYYVALCYNLGIKNDLKVNFSRINKFYGDLPIEIELDMEILMWADQHNLSLLYDIYMIAGLESLLQVAQKYKLPMENIIDERNKYANIPNTIEECEKYVVSGFYDI